MEFNVYHQFKKKNIMEEITIDLLDRNKGRFHLEIMCQIMDILLKRVGDKCS